MTDPQTKKILIVDDDIDVLTFVRKDLERMGFIVDTAIDINSAFDLLKKNKYQLAMLDIILEADVTSERIVNFIHEDGHINSHIPMIVMSAHMSEKYEAKIKEKCPDVKAGINKPIGKGMIQSFLTHILGFKESEEMATKSDKVFDIIDSMSKLFDEDKHKENVLGGQQLEGEEILYQGSTDHLGIEDGEFIEGTRQDLAEESMLVKGSKEGPEDSTLVKGSKEDLAEESMLIKGSHGAEEDSTIIKGSKEDLAEESMLIKGSKDDSEDSILVKGTKEDLSEDSTMIKGTREEINEENTIINGTKEEFNDENIVIKGEKEISRNEKVTIKGGRPKIESGNYHIKNSGDNKIEHSVLSSKKLTSQNNETPVSSTPSPFAEHEKEIIPEMEKVEVFDPNQRNDQGQTLVMRAASQGDDVAITQLLDGGADANLLCRQGRNSLHYAAMSGNPEAINKLVKAGVKIQHKDSKGFDPMAFSILSGSVAAVQAFIKAGSRLESKINGKTYLIMAVERNDLSTVKALLAAGINIDLRDPKGMTASDVARKLKYIKIHQFIEAFKQLKKKKAA